MEARCLTCRPTTWTRSSSFDGTEIAVRAAGDPAAPVLLFAHGFSLDMSIVARAVGRPLGGLPLRADGPPGARPSGRAAHGDLSLRAMGRDLAAVLDAVAPDRPAVVIGHSMGAMAILALAEQRPELFGPRVAGVVLIGAASSDLLRGAMGSVTELLRPRLGTFATAASASTGFGARCSRAPPT